MRGSEVTDMQRHMPIGYKLVDGKVVSDTKKTETIQKVFNDYLNGSSIRKIAEKLTATGFPNADNKPSWNHGSVGRILENIKYLGDEMYPQIIDEETFQSVQSRRKSRNKKLCRTQEINSKKNESIFIGKLICGECGEPYRQYITDAGKPEEDIAWKCNNHSYQRKMKCRNLILNEKDIEDISISGTNKLLSRIWMLDKKKKKEPPKINMEIRNLEEKVKELEEEEKFSSKELSELIFRRAKAYYDISKINDYNYNTRKIKEELIGKEQLIEFEEDLFIKIIKQITIYKNGKISVEYINGITMEGEYEEKRKE